MSLTRRARLSQRRTPGRRAAQESRPNAPPKIVPVDICSEFRTTVPGEVGFRGLHVVLPCTVKGDAQRSTVFQLAWTQWCSVRRKSQEKKREKQEEAMKHNESRFIGRGSNHHRSSKHVWRGRPHVRQMAAAVWRGRQISLGAERDRT